MKTSHVGDTIFHHRTNYDGDVEVIVKPKYVEHVDGNGVVGEYYVVKVPFDHLKKLVLDYFRNKVTDIVESDDEDFEKWIMRNL